MSPLASFFFGVMVAALPSTVIYAFAIWRGVGLREDQEMPR